MAGADDSGVSLSNLDHSALSDSTPLVFQCSNCNSVVGDSLSWVSADKIMRTIALSGWTSGFCFLADFICMCPVE